MNKWIKRDHFELVRYCCLCGDATNQRLLCASCAADIPRNVHSCRFCALPLPASATELVCGQCQQQRPSYQSAYSFAVYAPPLDRMIQQLKFHQKLYYASYLGEIMSQHIHAANICLPDVLLPVPLHAQRLRQRGYNQALEIARPLAKAFNIALAIDYCHRIKSTEEQTKLTARRRKSNLKNAFRVNRELTNLHITIVDDVMTTGATLEELSKQLHKAGARRVDVWVCARASL